MKTCGEYSICIEYLLLKWGMSKMIVCIGSFRLCSRLSNNKEKRHSQFYFHFFCAPICIQNACCMFWKLLWFKQFCITDKNQFVQFNNCQRWYDDGSVTENNDVSPHLAFITSGALVFDKNFSTKNNQLGYGYAHYYITNSVTVYCDALRLLSFWRKQ